MLTQAFNTCSLNLHFEDTIIDPNLSSSHILCLNKTKIQNITIHKNFTKKYLKNVTSCLVMINMNQ